MFCKPLIISSLLKNEYSFTFSGQVRSPSQRQNASKVFIEFVKEQLNTAQVESRMGFQWERDISNYIRFWSTEDAENFLKRLIDLNIKLDHILRLLQAPDYLEQLRTGQISLDFLKISNVVVIESVSPVANQQSLTVLQNTISDQIASDIFIERARQYFRAEFEFQREKKYKNMTYEEAFQKKMGTTWEDRIRRYTKNWTSEDARAF